MNNNKFNWGALGKNLLEWLIYTVISYICLIPLQLWIPAIGISLLSGLFLGLLNVIRREGQIIRMHLHKDEPCECCDKDEDKPDELIKS